MQDSNQSMDDADVDRISNRLTQRLNLSVADARCLVEGRHFAKTKGGSRMFQDAINQVVCQYRRGDRQPLTILKGLLFLSADWYKHPDANWILRCLVKLPEVECHECATLVALAEVMVTNNYGSRITEDLIKRFTYCELKAVMIDVLIENSDEYATNRYANHILQKLVLHFPDEHLAEKVLDRMLPRIKDFVQHPLACHVVRTIILQGDDSLLLRIVSCLDANHILQKHLAEKVLVRMLPRMKYLVQHPFASHVVRTIILQGDALLLFVVSCLDDNHNILQRLMQLFPDEHLAEKLLDKMLPRIKDFVQHPLASHMVRTIILQGDNSLLLRIVSRLEDDLTPDELDTILYKLLSGWLSSNHEPTDAS